MARAQPLVGHQEHMMNIKMLTPTLSVMPQVSETDIAEFMYMYRPKYVDIKYWNEYDAINYIKISYLKYKEGVKK